MPDSCFRFTQNRVLGSKTVGSVGVSLILIAWLDSVFAVDGFARALHGHNILVLYSIDGTPFYKQAGIVSFLIFFVNMIGNWQHHIQCHVFALHTGGENDDDFQAHFAAPLADLCALKFYINKQTGVYVCVCVVLRA
jgi:hypothetical protein